MKNDKKKQRTAIKLKHFDLTIDKIEFPLSEEECLKIGGHCMVLDPAIPMEPPFLRLSICKHCGHRRILKRKGDINAPLTWEEIFDGIK